MKTAIPAPSRRNRGPRTVRSGIFYNWQTNIIRDRQLVIYWFQAHGRAVAGDYEAKYYLIADSIRLHRSDGSLVRLMTPMLQGESADIAQTRVMKVGDGIIPLLDNYIPR